MKNVIDELKASFVLTRQEIERIKLYVVKKHPENSSKENAYILSRTMNEIIDRNLDGINIKEKNNIKKTILRSTILKDKENILKWDIFKAYMIETEENPKLKTPLLKWININQKNLISQENLENYMVTIRNTSYIEKAATISIKLQPKYNIFKFRGLSTYKYNIKCTIDEYKKKFLLKISLISKKTNTLMKDVSKLISSTKIALSILTLLILSLYSLNDKITITNNNILRYKNKSIATSYLSKIEKYDLYLTDVMSYHPYLPDYFNYKTIDKIKLSKFLNHKNSMLAEEPYFSAIIRASKEFNLNPHILFAITGQEQSFVPKNHENANKIANNPFNVFHSWQEYNTDIYDSSRIAARTVINLSKDKPTNIDIFDWINNKYAFDKKWGKGVKEIFETLNE